MPCCRAEEESGWCGEEDVVYTDGDGKEYCLFHAPADQKSASVEEFNKRVFEKIRNTPKGEVCNLNRTNFPGKIVFSSFDKNNPLPGIVLSDAAFSEYVNFRNVAFSGFADFGGAAFSRHADFSIARFNGTASFQRATFKMTAFFSQAAFSDFVDFTEAAFSGVVLFLDAAFKGMALFKGVAFSGYVMFKGAAFRGDVGFIGTEFSGNANFADTLFDPKKMVRFTATRFKRNADFERTVFKGLVSFDRPEVSDEKPISTSFLSDVSFRRAIFVGSTDFFGVIFKGTARFAFCDVKERLRFENVDLTHASFLDAEVADVEFVNSKWPRKKARLLDRFFCKKDGSGCGRYQVMEEKLENPPWTKIETLYRRLKHKAKEEHNEPEVSEWHYSEKEMARKQGGIRWLVLFLYWLSSGYGERPLRAAGVLLGLLAVITLLMGWFGLEPGGSNTGISTIRHLSGLNWEQIVLLIENTIQNVLFIKNPRMVPIDPVPWEFVQTIFTRILIPIQFALFAFALRNKFRR